jgi:hypothetical protein
MSWRHPLPSFDERDHDEAIDMAGEYVGAPRLTSALLDGLDRDAAAFEAFGRASLSLVEPVIPASRSCQDTASPLHADRAAKADPSGNRGHLLAAAGSANSFDICVEQTPEHIARRYRREQADERAARAALYGMATRSGDVTDVGPCDRRDSFQYEQTDVPPGMRLADWRSQKNATPPGATGEAA